MSEIQRGQEASSSDTTAAAPVPTAQWPAPDPGTAIDPIAGSPSSPLPPPPTAPEGTKRDARFTAKRLTITFVVVLGGVVAGTLIANALTNSGSSDDQAMGSWMSSYGSTFLAVSHDTAAVNSSTNATALRAACLKLQSDVDRAQSDPPMPISSLEEQWSSVESNLSASADDCVKGIDQQSRSLLTTAQNHMNNAGQAYLRLVKAVEQVQ